MSARRYRLTITSPTGTVLDAVAVGAAELSDLGTIAESPEADLSILTHGDMSLTLDNQDGSIEAFLEQAGPSDIYEVVLERKQDNSAQWDRMFGGVLDLPYSLSYDDKAKTAHVVAYTYTKLLERVPADGTAGPTTVLRRPLANKTASINSGSSQLVFLSGEASDLEIGDVVKLNDGQNSEEFTITRKIDASNAKVAFQASNTFATAFAQVITPFFHDKDPKALFALVAQEAKVDFDDRDLGSPLATFPIATPLSLADFSVGGEPQSLVGGISLTVTFPPGFGGGATGNTRKVLDALIPDPAHIPPLLAKWIDGATSNVAQLDWTPYMDTAPGTIQGVGGITAGASMSDSGVGAPDHANNHVYEIKGDGGSPFDVSLYRSLNGAASTKIITVGPTGVYTTAAVEFTYPNQRVFVSLRHSGTTRSIQYWNVGTGLVSVSTSVSGWMRAVRYGAGQLLMLVNDQTNNIEIWDTGLAANIRTIPWRSTDRILYWTMRTWGVGTGISGRLWFTFLFERYNETWLAIFDARGHYLDWQPVAEYRIASALSANVAGSAMGIATVNRRQAYQTTLTDVLGNQLAVVYGGGQWAVLATFYAGVIRYADFVDSSCAKAARDIAVILNSIVKFSRYRVMSIRNRRVLGTGDPVATLGVPITSVRRPNSDLYRSSVSVQGSDSSGNQINEIQGDQGDSARRVSVESDLITTPGMALACALTTLQFVSQIRQQLEVTVDDDQVPLSVFDIVLLDGKRWLIYKLETDLEQEVHHLTLLEMKP